MLLGISLIFGIFPWTSEAIEIPVTWKNLITEACGKFEFFSPGLVPCIVEARQIKRISIEELELCFFPKLLLWDPLLGAIRNKDFPVLCPEHYEELEPTDQWMNGSSNSRNPRVLIDSSYMTILVAREYECPGSICERSHRIRTTDTRLLEMVGTDFEEILFSRKFCMRRAFLSMMIDQLLSGVSFRKLHFMMLQRMQEFIFASRRQAESMLSKRNKEFSSDDIGNFKMIEDLLYGIIPDHETLKRILNDWCELNEDRLEASLLSKNATALMVDHTFKVPE